MKAIELMIGDWVFIDHCSGRMEPCYGRVTGIDRNGEDVYTTEGMVDEPYKARTADRGDTEARLDFITIDERGMYGVTVSPYYVCKGSPRIYCDGDPFAVWFEDEVDIRYVHQLQHVLRLCGLGKKIKLEV